MKNEKDPFNPDVTLLTKLGSIIIHADESLSPNGHDFDRQTFKNLLEDEDVKTWLSQMDKLAMLPKKR